MMQGPPTPPPPDFDELLAVFIVAIVSAFISVTQKVLQGTPATVLWLASELAAAILFGYLASTAYPYLKPYLHEAITLPVCVSFAAYSGGRMFPLIETVLLSFVQQFKRGPVK